MIAAPQGYLIRLEFLTFNTEGSFDYVRVYDGLGTNSRILALYSGDRVPASVMSTQNTMMVMFVADDSVEYSGFSAVVRFGTPMKTFSCSSQPRASSPMQLIPTQHHFGLSSLLLRLGEREFVRSGMQCRLLPLGGVHVHLWRVGRHADMHWCVQLLFAT